MAGIVGTITNLSDFLSKTQVCLSVKPNDPQQQIICLEADRKYSIPAFQREVRWDDNNLKMLLYDLSRSSKFLGNIILTIKSDHTCEIIDGQQRTTVLIFSEIHQAFYSRRMQSQFDFINKNHVQFLSVMCSNKQVVK